MLSVERGCGSSIGLDVWEHGSKSRDRDRDGGRALMLSQPHLVVHGGQGR
jgi:hypothetical protein